MQNNLPLAIWASTLLSIIFVNLGLAKKKSDFFGPNIVMGCVMLFVTMFTLGIPIKEESYRLPVIAKHDKTTIYYFDAVNKENGILTQIDYCKTNTYQLGRTTLLEKDQLNFIGCSLSRQYFYTP